MNQRVLAGMFRTHRARERAKEGLLAIGISESACAAISRKPGPPELGLAELSNRLTSVAAFYAPKEDLQIYLEGLRRGIHLLVTCVPTPLAEEAARVFERCEAINILEQVDEWRQSDNAASPNQSSQAAHDTKGYSLGPSVGIKRSSESTPLHQPEGSSIEPYSTHRVPGQSKEDSVYSMRDTRETSHDTTGFSIGPDSWKRRDIQNKAGTETNPYGSPESSPLSWFGAGRVRSYSA
jgi:hypothetical protein